MDFSPIIRSQSDLLDVWTTLMQPLGFSRHSVWLMLIGSDDRPVPQLTELEDAERPPTPAQLTSMAETLQMLRDELVPGGRFAFLRSRPGAGGITRNDRDWARALYDAGRAAGVPVEVVHRACDVDLVPIPMDDVLARSA